MREILVVEDNELTAETIYGILEDMGSNPVYVSSGEEAITLIKENPGRFKAGIIDVWLPGMDGISLIGQILEVEPEFFGIAITAKGSVENEEECIAAGFKSYVRKPIDNTFMRLLQSLS